MVRLCCKQPCWGRHAEAELVLSLAPGGTIKQVAAELMGRYTGASKVRDGDPGLGHQLACIVEDDRAVAMQRAASTATRVELTRVPHA